MENRSNNAAPPLKQLVISNLHRLEEHRANRMFQEYYPRWGELSAAEWSYAFRLEATAYTRADKAGPRGVG